MKERSKWPLLILILVITMVAWAYYHFSLSKEPADRIIRYKQEEQQLSEIIDKLYQDSDRVHPKTRINAKEIDRIGAKVADYGQKIQNPENKIQLAFDTYLKKVQVQPLLNQYFDQDVVTDQGFTEGRLKDLTDLNQAYDLRLKYYFFSPRDSYEEKINAYLDMIKEQADLLLAASSELEDLEYLPKTEEYKDVIAKAVKDILEVEAQLPSNDFKSNYSQIINQRFKELGQEVSGWDWENLSDLVNQVPRLKEYIDLEDEAIEEAYDNNQFYEEAGQ